MLNVAARLSALHNRDSDGVVLEQSVHLGGLYRGNCSPGPVETSDIAVESLEFQGVEHGTWIKLGAFRHMRPVVRKQAPHDDG